MPNAEVHKSQTSSEPRHEASPRVRERRHTLREPNCGMGLGKQGFRIRREEELPTTSAGSREWVAHEKSQLKRANPTSELFQEPPRPTQLNQPEGQDSREPDKESFSKPLQSGPPAPRSRSKGNSESVQLHGRRRNKRDRPKGRPPSLPTPPKAGRESTPSPASHPHGRLQSQQPSPPKSATREADSVHPTPDETERETPPEDLSPQARKESLPALTPPRKQESRG